MKKRFYLVALLLMTLSIMHGQNTHYQLPYTNFDNWINYPGHHNGSGENYQPLRWYSFNNMECLIDAGTCEAIYGANGFKNHHLKVPGHTGSAVQLYTVKILGKNVNGLLTTGRPVLASANLADPANHIYTDRSGNYKWTFSGRPDSISLWARFSFRQNEYPKAMMRVHIHGDVDYRDVANYSASTAQAGKIANAYCEMVNPATTPTIITTHDTIYASQWTRFAFKFRYWTANNQPISTPTLSNTTQPSYILATLCTNRTGNVGENDSVAYDAIYCIYDKSLASLKLNNVENTEIKEFFNAKEFITHEKEINSGAITYEYDNLICYNSEADIPQVSATAKSSLIISINVTQATLANPNATITVMHNDSSTYAYTIHFANLHPAVSVSLDHDNSTYSACEGENITVTASGASNYTWSNGSTGSTIHPTASGQYTVTGTNDGSCQSVKTAYVVVNPIPDVNILGNTTICAGTSTTLTATGAYSYLWSTGATTQSINVSSAGTYSVTGTSSAGCSSTSSATVIVHDAPIIIINGVTEICNGTESILTASSSQQCEYVWNNGAATGPTFTISTGGIYTVSGTSDAGCTGSASLTVQGKPTPTVSISGPSLICSNSPTTLTASSNLPGVDFVWSTGVTGNTLTVYYSGFYAVTASLNGCQSTALHPISSTAAPAAPTVTPAFRCGTGSVTLTASSVAGTSCYWYASNTSQEVLAVGETYTTPPLSVTSTYYVCAQNDAGCVSSRTPVTASIYSQPSAPTVSSFSQCGEADITLTANAEGPVEWYSDAQGLNVIPATQHISVTTTFYAAVVNGEECRSTLSPLTVTVTEKPQAPTVTIPDPICSNSSVNVTLSATSTPGTNIKWYDSNMNYKGQGNTYQAKNITTTTTYYATCYNSDCESDPTPVTIVKNPLPDVPTVSCAPLCAPGLATLSADAGGLSVKWLDANNNILSEGLTYTPSISATTLFQAIAFDSETSCESAPVNVTAIVSQTSHNHISVNSCTNYTWNGHTYTQSGEYTDTLQNIYGCDSLVTLHLQINASFETVIDTTVCGQFTWEGQTYTSSQTITKTLTSSTNCDSTVTIHLTVYQSVQVSKTVTLCSDELPYHYGGMTFTSAGTTVFTITSASGCDSTVTLTLIVNPKPTLPTLTSTDLTRCGEGNVTLSGTPGTNGTICRWYSNATDTVPFLTSMNAQYSFAESTTIYASSYNANSGCESGRSPVTITIRPIPNEPEVSPVTRCGAGQVTLTATIDETATNCRWYSNNTTNNPMHYGLTYTGNVVISKSFYVESYNLSTGCKSARIPVEVTVNAPPTPPQTTPIANCGPLTVDLANYVSSSTMQYRWYDEQGELLSENQHYSTTINETSTFYVSLYNDFTTCESNRSALTVTINSNYAPQHIYDTVCQNARYQNYNIDQIFVTPGTSNLIVNTQTSAGCDSLVTLHLYVKPQITNQITVAACDQYEWADSIYTQSGIYVRTFTAVDGCDSVVTLNLTISPSDQVNIYAVACDQYEWNGISYSQTGIYTQTLQNYYGCDSTIILHLTINPSYHQDTTVTACEEFTLNHETFYTSGDYIQQYTTTEGCDSIINLHLTIYHADNVILYDEACEGSAYTQNGFDTTFATAGEYTLVHTGFNIHGCDSITILHLTVHPAFSFVEEASVCYNESYEFNGQTLSESGEYVANLSTTLGCDSIITLHLTVLPKKIDTIIAHTCLNVSYHDIGFDIYNPTENGYYYTIDYDVNDCDSTTVLYLIVDQPAATTLTTTLCVGESYMENGFDVTATEPGEFTFTQDLQTTLGCDSIVTLNVTVNPTHQLTFYDTVCSGIAYSQFGFDTLCANAGEYTLVHHDANVYGCDSTTTLHLTVYPSYTQNITSMICQSGSYQFNGQTLTQSGIYTANLTTIHGCDSIVTLNLTVGAEYRDTIVAHICAGDSYTLNGFSIDQPTETQFYQHNDVAQNGCDSTTVLHLFVHELNTTELYATICQGENYSQNGFSLTPNNAGDTTCTRIIPTEYGCDSTVILHLTVNPTHSITFYGETCAGSRYTAHGFDTLFLQAGLYTLIHTNQNLYGCDSTTTLLLTVHAVPETVINAAICFNESYVFNGHTLTESGTYIDTLISVNQCDSIVTLNLTVYPEKRDTIVAHICKGTSYSENGFDIVAPSATDFYTNTFPDVHGCDSTTVLHLFVHDSAVTHLYASVCYGEAYTENGFDITTAEAGDHTFTRELQTAFECDSTVYLHLTVNPTYHLTDTLTVCQSNEPYLYAPANQYFSIAEAGQYDTVLSYTTTAGCDSILTLTLHILPSYIMEESVTLCDNSELLPYAFGNMTLNETGDYTYTFTAANGCDSTVTLHLTVNPTDTVELTLNACGEYWWNDSLYTESGDYTQSFENMTGCDSTVIVHLTVFPVYQHEVTETVCGSYVWNDETYDVSGDYVQQLTSINGCDSIVTLHLTVKPVSLVEHAVTLCQGEPLNLFGFDTVVSTPGIHTLTRIDENIYECDSITTVTLTVLPTYSIDTIVNVCDVDVPFLWDNNDYFSYTETGDYDIALQTIHNCDSIIHLHLFVNPTYEKDTMVTVCNGALPYTFCEGHSFTQSGEHTVTLQSSTGCDSVWHLQLTVIPNAEHDAYITICDNELPYNYLGESFAAAGNYDITETDDDNCITITHLTLNVNPTYHGYDTVTVCEETLPYLYGNTPLTASGEYDVHLSANTSCDSMITVLFTVIPSARDTVEQTACSSEFPISFGGSLFTEEGIYDVAFHREGLCDSIVTFILHEAPEFLDVTIEQVCEHELPFYWRGIPLSQSGFYTDSLTTALGCDSVYRLQLTVHETQWVESDPIVLCAGETAEWRNMTLSETGIYRDTVTDETTGCYIIYQVSVNVHPTYLFEDTVTVCSDELPYIWHDIIVNEAGSREILLQTAETYCDSIYRLTLYVNPTYHFSESDVICDYDLPYLWRGLSLTTSGDYHDTLTTANGCDSIYTLNLTVNPSTNTTTIDTVCENDLPYVWRGLMLTAAGSYYDTIPNTFGCIDIFGLQLTVNHTSDTTIHDAVCAGDTYTGNGFNIPTDHPSILYDQRVTTNVNGCDSTIIIVLNVLPSYVMESNGETCENVPFSWRGHEYTEEGTYYDSLVTVTGCDSVFVLHLTLNPVYDIYVSDSAIREHEYTYDNFVVTPSDSGTFNYDIQYYTLFGCDSVVHLTLYVAYNDGIIDHTLLPEFSFYPNPTTARLNISGERMRRISMYNVNGKLVYSAEASSPEAAQIDVTAFASGYYLVHVLLDDGQTITRKIVINRY